MKRSAKMMMALMSVTLVFGAVGSTAFAAPTSNAINKSVATHNKNLIEIDIGHEDLEDLYFKIKERYPDVTGQDWNWAYDSIGNMTIRDVFDGFVEDHFRPHESVTRIESIVTAVRLMGLESAAKAKAANATLHFKDANKLESNYAWAKGYVLVALERGLFDPNETELAPHQPATRVWVSSLLVRALGLQQQALQQMTTIPNFKDKDSIPAGAVGYVNVAVQSGILVNLTDGSFQPQKPVTRAELAVLLDRTNDCINDKDSIRIAAKFKQFSTTSPNASTPVDSQQRPLDSTLRVENVNGQTVSYAVSSKLPVRDQLQYVPLHHLKDGDWVSLVIRRNNVEDVSIINRSDKPIATEIKNFSVNIRQGNDTILQTHYFKRDGYTSAYVNQRGTIQTGDQAKNWHEQWLNNLALRSNFTKQQLIDNVLRAAGTSEHQATSYTITVDFADGTQLEAVKHPTNHPNPNPHPSSHVVQELDIEIEGRKEKHDIDAVYERSNNGTAEAYIERDDDDEVKGQEAVRTIERWLSSAQLNDSMTKTQIADRLLNALNLKRDQLEAYAIDVRFTNGKTISIDWERD
ncbi:S-layer homology domain-containing protein [Paenibacillus sp. 481]|uniref:S-layer homology domain-containing protein n=1 Tax=Paenibacillus sp. 481 TaxID=2835869 RepID=UPI001E2F24CA|nr:S-layer homology domain-containing protein [Paenibacillus sp. 481]UHA75052.1 S-layer homology domain-containing protein [Paenibacillus sp. 481]